MKTKITMLVLLFMLSMISVNAQIKFNRNIPNEAHKKIAQLLPKGINSFSFSPNGGWVIVTKTNETFSRNIPNECYLKMKELKKKGHKIQQISFPPKGGKNSWIIITDKSTYARNIPNECYTKIQALKKQRKRIKSVSFPFKSSSNNSWVIITTDGTTYSRNIPDECYQIMQNLKQSDMPNKRAVRKITQVSFTPSGGWVVLAGDYFFARNIPDEAFRQLKSFRSKKYKSQTIAFTPNGKGWSLIANDKYSRTPKDLIRKFEDNVAGKSIWQAMRDNNVPGVSIAVVINGKIAWKTAYGHLKKGDKKHAVHPKSMFQAASISKVFAAIGVHKLVDQKKVSLTENLLTSGKLKIKIPLHECLNKKDFKNFNSVTIENILQHRSGISGRGALIKMKNKNCDLDKDGNIQYLGKNAGGGYGGSILDLNKLMKDVSITYNPSEEPNDKSRWYSGKAFTTLQKLSEDITGKSYANWMKREVLNPMGMYKSRFTVNPEKFYANDKLTWGYNGRIVRERHPQYAAAGLYTNALELANMIIMINNNGVYQNRRILSTEAIENLIDNDMGVNVKKEKETVKYYAHGGSNAGYKTYFKGFPSINVSGVNSGGIVVLTNGTHKTFRYEITNAIIKAYGW